MTASNRRCPCGYSRFMEKKVNTTDAVQRWMLFTNPGSGGFGSTPFGTYFGAGGSGSSWGRFDGTRIESRLQVSCEKCQRQRSYKQLSGIAPFGIYVEDNFLYVACSDTSRPVTAYYVEFEDGDRLVTAELSYFAGTPPAIAAATPGQTAPTPPAGAVIVDTLLRARLPEVDTTDTYTATLVDRISGARLPLTTLVLEATPMILSPRDAALDIPDSWVSGHRVRIPTNQPASSPQPSIPFDKCTVVVEYDARFATLPSAQGWTHQGTGLSGNYQLVEGNALRVVTLAPNASYWEKTVLIAAKPAELHAYATFQDEDAPGVAVGEGFDFRALYASSGSSYDGLRLVGKNHKVYATKIDGSGEAIGGLDMAIPPGWGVVGGSDVPSGNEAMWLPPTYGGDYLADVDVFGILAGPAPNTRVVARFGDTSGLGISGYIRNFVVSGPGRFVRARFAAYSFVANPVLRVYMTRDAYVGAATVRFRVRYAQVTSSPYAVPSTYVDFTTNLVTANQIYEVPVTVPGLTPNAPFTFTLERVYNHADDDLDATVHVFYATVRAS